MSKITHEEGIKRICELADDEFLSKLIEILKLYGWEGDYEEMVHFIEYIYAIKDKEPPDLDPYDITDKFILIP